MGVTCKVPQLRFREFSGEFNILELDALIEVSSKKVNPKIINKNYKCIELEHISQGTGELLGYTFSKDQASTKNLFLSNQVLFGKLRPYLKKFLQPKFNGVCSSEIWVLNGKEIINDYLFQLVQTSKFNLIANVSSGSKMPRADWKYMSQIPFLYPSKQEQEKIASFLSAVDSRIEQLTKKEQLLREYKKGVMQKIFSQELRFKDDDGSAFPEWVETKLGELFTFLRGSSLSKADIALSGKYKCIHYGELFTIYHETITTIKSKTNLDTGQFSKIGDILMPSSDVTPQGLATASALLENNVIIGGDINILRAKKQINSIFMSYFLNSNKNEIMKLVTGTTVKHIYNKDISKLKTNLPSLKEQTKIANFLSSLDTKIEQTSKELKLTKEFKKALLQKMFV